MLAAGAVGSHKCAGSHPCGSPPFQTLKNIAAPHRSCQTAVVPLRIPTHRRWVQMHSKGQQKSDLGDDLLDFVQAGPKLRKWYGAAERTEKDSSRLEQPPGRQPEDEEDEADKPSICVTNADSAIGEQVVLQLILAREPAQILVRDTVAAKTSYGPYLQPLSFDVSSPPQLIAKALRGIETLVLLGPVGKLLEAARIAGIKHVVLLSGTGSTPSGGPFAFLLGNELADVSDAQREEAVRACGLPFTIVRVFGIDTASRGGTGALKVTQGAQKGSSVSREDLAQALVQTISAVPKSGRVIQVSSDLQGNVLDDWDFLQQLPEEARR